MSPAHSDALSPIQMGSLTGSVKAMAESKDFRDSFKKLFKLKHLGLWWAYPKSELAWTKNQKKFSVHYEIDMEDIDKNEDIISYFNKKSSMVDKIFFGTPMIAVPIFTPFLDDEVKMRITTHAKKQLTLGTSMKSVSITGVQLLNWAIKSTESTLHRELMLVESVYNKKVIKASGNTSFKGRLFYAIIPNQKTKTTTFYYSSANADEARSVARGLPLFIRDYFKLDPKFYCSSDTMVEALAGEWDFEKRIYLTQEEKEEKEKFAHLVDTMTATKEAFISESHQKAFAAEGDDVSTVVTQLTKDDDAPPPASSDDMSILTGNTTESKAVAYAAKETKKVASQYINTINDINGKHEEQVGDLQAKLDAALLQLNLSKNTDSKTMINEGIKDTNTDEDSYNSSDEEDNKSVIVQTDNDDTSMSGLSLSSDDGDTAIVVGVRKANKNQQKGSTASPFCKNRD